MFYKSLFFIVFTAFYFAPAFLVESYDGHISTVKINKERRLKIDSTEYKASIEKLQKWLKIEKNKIEEIKNNKTIKSKIKKGIFNLQHNTRRQLLEDE
jgi:hypothetical protein